MKRSSGSCEAAALERLLGNFGDAHGRAVAQDLAGGILRADLRPIVVHPHDRIRSELFCMLDHGVEGVLTRLLAHFDIGADASADDALETAEEPLNEGGGANGDPADDAEVFNNFMAFDSECGGDNHGYGVLEGCINEAGKCPFEVRVPGELC